MSAFVRGSRSHSSQKSVVILSSLFAVCESSPAVRAVKVASLAVAVRQRACVTCVQRPAACRSFRRLAVAMRFAMRRCNSGACSSRNWSWLLGSGMIGIGWAVLFKTVGRFVRGMPMYWLATGWHTGSIQHSVLELFNSRPRLRKLFLTHSSAAGSSL